MWLTRRIAHVRIHVERAIRCLKVSKILSQVVPITMAPKVDKILRICAALVSLTLTHLISFVIQTKFESRGLGCSS